MQSSSGLSRHARFKILSENISAIIEEEGLLVRPYGHATLPYFNLLSIEEQERVLKDILTFFQVCTDVKSQGSSLKDTRLFTEKAIARIGVTADPAILDLIEPHHLIEIYTQSQTQIFRSLKFFEVCSYSLEDLYCRKWYHLYQRTPEDQEKLEAEIGLYYSNSPLRTIKGTAPEHTIRATTSLERNEIITQILWFSPLFSNTKEDSYILTVATSRLP
ncbi:hypothetical protein [Bdellovibrio bacteriovorus]|uniref:Uncharacterized protein n=1 Tax=Bdellovibrio bacteriovorus str. Tiberius TaxID=1069642 RepID=K7YRL3_BDEBC|nr:hypothetical protein [Bdellovibrio bacteriovorus]AFY02496.1 hypothetical protein Bdt_2815 [Bdellovibrio bacteriovorus str. Tiberius]